MADPFEDAKSAGYSQEEIFEYLSKDKNYSDKINKARESGYQDNEIFDFISKSNTPKEERSKYESFVERPAQIIASSTVAGTKALPRTAYDVLKAIVDKTGGNLENLKEFEENSPEWLKKAASTLFPTFEEVRETQQKPTPDLKRKGSAKPEGFIEKTLEKGGRFLGESPAFGGAGGIRGLSGITGAALGAQAGEDLNLNPMAQVALTLGGSILGHKVGGGRAGLGRQTLTPEVEQYIAASRELGIDPMATGMNPSQLQKVAQKYATHGIGGPQILQDAYESRSAQVSRAFERAMDEAGENLFGSKFEAGLGLQEGIQDATRQVEHTKSQLYRAIDETLPQFATTEITNPNQMRQNLERSIGSLGDSISMSHPETATYRRLTNLHNELETLMRDLDGEIPVRTLDATNRSLNEVIRYDRPGGVDKLLVPTARDIRRELEQYGRTNQQYDTARRAANEYFANDVVHIRQNLLQSIARSEKPESVLAIMNTQSGIRNVERALNHLPNGRQLTDSLKRYKLAEMIRDKIIDPGTGLMKVDGLKKFLSRNSTDYPIIRELAGNRGIETLRHLEHAGRGLEKGFNNLVNPSRTADTFLAINSVLSPGKKIASGIGKLVKGKVIEGPLEVLTGSAQILVPKILSRMIMSPEFANDIYRLSNASRASDWRSFNKILDIIDKDLKKDNNKYDEYLSR